MRKKREMRLAVHLVWNAMQARTAVSQFHETRIFAADQLCDDDRKKVWFLVPIWNSNQASQSQFETSADQECSKLRIWKSSRAVLAMVKGCLLGACRSKSIPNL